MRANLPRWRASPSVRRRLLLPSLMLRGATQDFSRLSLYAAAADRARYEDWPDDAWKHWRYRRATLARLLAREGMMQQVADAYVKESATSGLHMNERCGRPLQISRTTDLF